MKYNAIAFKGRKQMHHLTDVEYSANIENFIKDNEAKGFSVLVDVLKDGKVKRNAYSTKNEVMQKPLNNPDWIDTTEANRIFDEVEEENRNK